MNIFATSPCPVESAVALDDVRVIKMILESAQMLSGAIYVCSGKVHDDIYKPTHLKHPCTVWATSSSENWKWLYKHTEALCAEYTFRYEREHKTKAVLQPLWNYHLRFVPEGEMSPFVNCTRSTSFDQNFLDIADVHLAYRMYLSLKYSKSSRMPRWTKRPPPTWAKDVLEKRV